jgi:hypothetical protein
MRSTAPTRTCALTWNAASPVTCWRWPPATGWPPPQAPAPPASSPPACRAWQRYSAGQGAKGHRYCDWAWLAIDPGRPGHRHLLSAAAGAPGNWRSTAATAPAASACSPWPGSPGSGGTTEENFRAGKGLAGLDEHQVRRWDSWYRWTTLAMLALAFLSTAAATEHTNQAPAGQIPLTRNEIAALSGTLITGPVNDARHRLRWSAWRRCHQHRVKTCHSQRQAARDP